jgi:multicomponent Na+:H+ antiporter subunit D
VLFGVAALSLAGIPPFSGFLAKLALVEAGLAIGQLAVVGVSLAVSVLTLYSMLKIWNAVFWKPAPIGEAAPSAGGPHTPVPASREPAHPVGQRVGATMLGPILLLVGCSLALALAAGPAFDLVDRAAAQLLDPTAYVEAVLGGVAR